jgi:hypothetical protein
MKSMIENWINGNLKEARKQAKRHSLTRIRETLKDEYGYSEVKSALVAIWLKTGEGYQASCDAE